MRKGIKKHERVELTQQSKDLIKNANNISKLMKSRLLK
jgi:hypothetical protein